MFTRALLPRLGDLIGQRPAAGGISFFAATGESLEDAVFAGDAYVDGSCTRSDVPELRRAAAALVVLDYASQPPVPKYVVSAPVWAPLLQTSPAAEFVAAAIAFQLATGPQMLTVYSDCTAVCKQHAAYPTIRPSAPYAGIVRDRALHGSARFVAPLVHVRAHQAIHAVPEHIRIHAIGNDQADQAAKAAIALHPPFPEFVQIEAERQVALATTILRLIAVQAVTWQKPKKSGARLLRVAAPETAPAAAPAPPARIAAAFRCHSTHSLWAAQGGVIFCANCGAYSATGRVAKLAAACGGAATPGGPATRLARLKAGKTLGPGAGDVVPPVPWALGRECRASDACS